MSVKDCFLSKTKEINIPRLLFLVSFSSFILLSVTTLLQHTPWFDEVNAWDIAANVSFFDLFKVTRHEGHMFIWYIILMPFAKNNLFYPYSLQFINLLFMSLAILLMWKFAPFNSIAKALITFSFPIRWHVRFARCYSIGILFLFAIAALYPKRMQHPLWYAFLIILAANTSAMAFIGSFAFGILFLYDLYKNTDSISKATLDKTLLIFAIGGGLILLQLWHPVPTYYIDLSMPVLSHRFFEFYIGMDYNIKKILMTTFYLLLLFLFPLSSKKNIRSLCFLYITTSMLLMLFFFVYYPYPWHMSFLFIYIIIAMWMLFLDIPELTKKPCTINYIFCLFFIFLVTYPECTSVFGYNSNNVQKYMEKNIEIFRNSKIFLFRSDFNLVRQTLPYLEKYHLNVYSARGYNHKSLDFYLTQWDYPTIDFENISELMGEDKIAYLFYDVENIDKFNPDNLKLDEAHGLKITRYKYIIMPLCIYIIEK